MKASHYPQAWIFPTCSSNSSTHQGPHWSILLLRPLTLLTSPRPGDTLTQSLTLPPLISPYSTQLPPCPPHMPVPSTGTPNRHTACCLTTEPDPAPLHSCNHTSPSYSPYSHFHISSFITPPLLYPMGPSPASPSAEDPAPYFTRKRTSWSSRNSHSLWVGMQNRMAALQAVWQFLMKLNTLLDLIQQSGSLVFTQRS